MLDICDLRLLLFECRLRFESIVTTLVVIDALADSNVRRRRADTAEKVTHFYNLALLHHWLTMHHLAMLSVLCRCC